MNKWVDSSSVQYAVIEARWTERPPERFVIAYRDEESLYDAIATPSIVAVGFTSREAAIAGIETCSSGAAAWRQIPRARQVDGTGKCQHGLHSAERRFGDWFDLAEIRGITRRALQDTVAATILIFSSRSVMSTVIRLFIGASF